MKDAEVYELVALARESEVDLRHVVHALAFDPWGLRSDLEEFFDSFNQAVEDFYWIAHITSTATRRATRYSLWSGVRTGARMLRAAGVSRSLDDFVKQYEEIAYEEMERLDMESLDSGGGRKGGGGRNGRGRRYPSEEIDVERLRERGGRLLELSADVDYEEEVHPAYPMVLEQVAPDEARLLRYLATEGPQPSVDIRDKGWLPLTSKSVASGLSMVGTEAGCRYEDWTQVYLNNLNRLGLVWFSDEPVGEVKRYQLLEAQPDVKGAIDGCKRPHVDRRSIHLTPFGVDFCRTCLPLDYVDEGASGVYKVPERRGVGDGV
ncbi:MAG: DUF4393 domain-containing protein [Halobacteriales archaeon]